MSKRIWNDFEKYYFTRGVVFINRFLFCKKKKKGTPAYKRAAGRENWKKSLIKFSSTRRTAPRSKHICTNRRRLGRSLYIYMKKATRKSLSYWWSREFENIFQLPTARYSSCWFTRVNCKPIVFLILETIFRLPFHQLWRTVHLKVFQEFFRNSLSYVNFVQSFRESQSTARHSLWSDLNRAYIYININRISQNWLTKLYSTF